MAKSKEAGARLALVCYDGSITVLAPGTSMADAEKARREFDRDERNLKRLTQIASVKIDVVETHFIAKKIEPPEVCDKCGHPHEF